MKTNQQHEFPGSVAGAPLVWLRLEGLFVLILSILCYAHTSASWWSFALLLLTPDASMLGYLLNERAGAVCYNLVHSYVGPVVLISVGVVIFNHQAWLAYAMIWTAHIGLDRTLGYGLKYPVSFKKTHLGLLGKGNQA